MNEIRNQRKAEIKALLATIETSDNQYREARQKTEKENFDKIKGFLPITEYLEFTSFEKEDWLSKETPKYSFRFETKERTSFSIEIQNKEIVYYSVTGCSDRNPSPQEFNTTRSFYSDVSIIMDFFSPNSNSNIHLFYLLSKSFSKADWEEYHAHGLNREMLSNELREIEQQERIEELDLKVGSVVSYYFEAKRRYEQNAWIIVKVTKITAKKFQYAQWHDHEKRWMDHEYEIQKGVIDYNRIRHLDEKQIKSMEGEVK